jgi:lysyl endopeptidase
VTSQGEAWTPSVAGPAIRLEVQVPEREVEGAGFVVDRVLQLFELDADGAARLDPIAPKADLGCLEDAACHGTTALGNMDVLQRAMALLTFAKYDSSYVCTGGLMNDTDAGTTIPYLLTAHHCIETQTEAASVEAFFDDIHAACNGAPPALGTLPRAVGATLLATGAATDFTLLRLSVLPPGRALLGSTSDPLPAGAVVHRLSFPNGQTMRYSRSTEDPLGPRCAGSARPNFFYSTVSLGGSFMGSSGAPALREPDGRVVGQLYAGCGPRPSEGCDRSNDTVDGAMAQTWPAIAPWLAPAAGAPCAPGPSTLCLNDGRFKVEAAFGTGTQQGQAQTVKLTEETGYLWFFSSANVEAVVKVLDACAFNQRFWVFAGGLTDVRVTLTITDTRTGTIKTYVNPGGTAFQPIQDTSAFATCP